MTPAGFIPPAVGAHDGDGLRELLSGHPRWTERYDGWEEVGRGSHATVVRTYCRDVGEHVAVKVFHHMDRRRFQVEVRNARQLDGPGTVRMYSPFWGSPPWIEMEYVDGPDLRRELDSREARRDPIPFLDVVDIGVALADVLAEAHRKGIVHRDVKPANILLPRSHRPLVKLADFGVSRAEGAPKLTSTGAFAGTPQFASPESWVGDEVLGPPHDVYSLGLTLYQVFTNNRFPWEVRPGAGPKHFMGLHVSVPPRSARQFVPDLDSAVDFLLLRCLAKKPAKRPTSQQVALALREIRARATGTCGRRAVRVAPTRAERAEMALDRLVGTARAALARRLT